MSIKEMHRCEECMKENKNSTYKIELHHIAFKSEAPLLRNIEINFKYLCLEHHKGKNGPHKNKYVDLIYKLELQDKLFEIFEKDYYSEKEIQQKLETTFSTARKICKKLMIHKNGYDKTELIRRLMGGMLYTRDMLEEYEYEKPRKNAI